MKACFIQDVSIFTPQPIFRIPKSKYFNGEPNSSEIFYTFKISIIIIIIIIIMVWNVSPHATALYLVCYYIFAMLMKKSLKIN